MAKTTVWLKTVRLGQHSATPQSSCDNEVQLMEVIVGPLLLCLPKMR